MQPVVERFSDRMTSARLTPSLRHGAVLLCGLCAVAGAAADVQHLFATQDPNITSSFTLDFGDGARSANITATQYTLEADPVALSAWFHDYNQTVDPLVLPGGISTGDMHVTIKNSLAGSYDPATGVFATQDTYLIYHTGDLSAYGLPNPVELSGSATGTITYLTDSTGTIVSGWAGDGNLGTVENPIWFHYTCSSSVAFTLVPEPGMLALLGLGALLAGRRR
jgi:MYXO-CTERM domain-containing protein